MSNLRDRRGRQDSFYRQAKRQGFAARSVFKLEELDHRFQLLKAGQRVLDLGCRPGSWLQYAASVIGPQGHIVGVDRQPLDTPPPTNASIVVGDVLTLQPTELQAALPPERKGCFQVVLSDMAPDTSGIPFTDQVRSAELFLRALELALALGCPGSSFVAKLFMGEGYTAAVEQVKQHYQSTKTVRPAATRRSSTEVYIVAKHKGSR